MRERKYVKLRSDMYDDTKFKIIDTMENRDTINYIWTRILTLCGKINNSFGYLLLSKNIIYTIDLLAIEFNRSKEQVEEAIDMFIELKMIDKDESGMLRVCNFGKHQGCKDKSKENNIEIVANKNEERLETTKNINEEKEKVSDKKENLNADKSIVESSRKTDTKLIQIQDISKEKKRNDKFIEIKKTTNSNKLYINEIEKDINLKKRKKKKQESIEVLGDCDIDVNKMDICGVVEDENVDLGKVVKTFEMS